MLFDAVMILLSGVLHGAEQKHEEFLRQPS